MSEQTREQLRQRLRYNNITTCALLACFIVVIAGIIYYQYRQYQYYTQPKLLVDTAEERIRDHYSEFRDLLKKEIVKSGPYLALKMRQQAKKRAPEAREELEQLAERYFALGMKESTEFSAEHFRDLVREYKEPIKKGYKELMQLPAETKEVVIDMEEGIEKYLGFEIEGQSKHLLAWYRAINNKLEKLSSGRITESEDLQLLRSLRILKTMQIQEKQKKIAQAAGK